MTFHGAVPPNVAMTCAVCPEPVVIVPPPLTVAEALHDCTVTLAVPPVVPAQPVASVTLLIVYVVVTVGATKRVKGFCVTFDSVTPSDHVTVHGAVPANVVMMCAVWPLPVVIVPPPLKVADALHDDCTVTYADPLLPAVQPVPSVALAIV